MTDPKIYSMWTEEGKALGRLCTAENKINAMGKFMTTFVTPTLHKQADGSVIERSADGRGSWIYAQWPNLSEALNYQPVFPKHVQNEQW